MPKAINLTGQVFGNLTVICEWGRNGWGEIKWMCYCSCGEYVVISSSLLSKGRSQSCGCLQRKLTQLRSTTHGMSKTPIYLVWNSIIQRCTNENHISYDRYGMRGVNVCNEWKDNFLSFYNWAILNGYEKGLQIDRKDNNVDYSPENCRFVTAEENGNNKRKSRKWIVNGKEFISSYQAGLYYGVCKRTIRNWCLGNTQKMTLPHPNCSAPKIYTSNGIC